MIVSGIAGVDGSALASRSSSASVWPGSLDLPIRASICAWRPSTRDCASLAAVFSVESASLAD